MTICEYFPGDEFSKERFLYHEAGHALALLVMGMRPEEAIVFDDWTNAHGKRCAGFVKPPTPVDSMPMPGRALFHIAGVAAEEWACTHGLLELRPRPSHIERQECRGYYSKEVYDLDGFTYVQTGIKTQEAVAARVEDDIRIIQQWIDSHEGVFLRIVDDLRKGQLNAADFEALWRQFFGQYI